MSGQLDVLVCPFNKGEKEHENECVIQMQMGIKQK